MGDFEKKIQAHIEPGARLIVALSGGPDSVCLFHHLLAFREALDLDIEACHLHHGLREEAQGDLDFVKNLCQAHQVPLHIRREDVLAYSQAQGLSVEEAGRVLRYQFFYQVAGPGAYIALGHHLDDQAETLLIRLIRGTGLQGLGGMRVLEGQLFRPLLDWTKEEILAWLEKEGHGYRIDKTNLEPLYLRNQIRLDLLPQLEALNPQIKYALRSLGHQAQEAEDYLKAQAARVLEDLLQEEEGTYRLPIKDLKALDGAILSRVLYGALASFLGTSRDLGSQAVGQLRDLLDQESGKGVQVLGGTEVRRSFDFLILERPKKAVFQEETPLSLGDNVFLGGHIHIKRVKEIEEPPSPWTIYLDPEGLKTLSLRSRQSGDRVLMFDGSGHKKLKDLFIEKKVDKTLRDQVPLVLADGVILWVVGLYRSGYRKLGSQEGPWLKISVEVQTNDT
ncbi:MAG: tRNA lysidine(34) synthetase TilS [Tissierellia bacterium]|nr:tRNA lysidine(34) synthetase TilS [Tissierellia bacterium]